MSESIAIPRRKGKQPAPPSSSSPSASTPTSTSTGRHQHAAEANLSTSASSSINPSTPSQSSGAAGARATGASAVDKGKARARGSDGGGTHAQSSSPWGHERRASLLSSSLSKCEHTVVNIGQEDAPRLITCVKASQGFDWNQDIFLPSYVSDHDYTYELEHRQDPVEDIFITEEEAERMFPR